MLGSVGRKWSLRISKTEKEKKKRNLSWKECARCWLGNGRRETQKMKKKREKKNIIQDFTWLAPESNGRQSISKAH
jgi:hypothetical protein